ncbi:MAG: DUF434 domain-containing protein [Kofleriaceae bacterium]|nr:DUF434 domain-containing protein [Kofleriaceae bacterium]MCB9572299.1 DUF434 domain-containing protein [Kofleriaceae bacterium]
MPRHRGPHPADRDLFSGDRLAALREAVTDLAWLRGRGYADDGAIALVGNRYQLRERARSALGRAAASDATAALRRARHRPLAEVAGRALAIDGFNVLVTLESALSGGVVLGCRDGALRDLGSVHGTYRHVEETGRALAGIAALLASVGPAEVTWYLDRPVSNSGRLAARLRELEPSWRVELPMVADPALVTDPARVVASADSWVIDRASSWVDLPAAVIEALGIAPWRVDLA